MPKSDMQCFDDVKTHPTQVQIQVYDHINIVTPANENTVFYRGNMSLVFIWPDSTARKTTILVEFAHRH